MSTIWKSTKSSNTRTGTVLSSWSRQQKLAIIACLAILAVLLILSACSKQSATTPVDASSSSSNSPTVPAAAAPLTPPIQSAATTSAPQTPAKKTSKKRAANVSYTDANSGVSFVYPRKFALSTGDKAQPQLSGEIVPMNFAEDGGTTVVTVALPKSLYPETDFANGFFSVNLNRNLSEEQCSHFAFVDTRNPDGEPVDAEKVKVGSADMEMTSEFAGSATKQAEAQYYHQYENGACYEYVLGLGTSGFGTTDGVKPVSRDDVFARLEKILDSVKVRPVVERETVQPPVTAAESAK